MEEVTLILCANCQAHHFEDETIERKCICRECGKPIAGEQNEHKEQEAARMMLREVMRHFRSFRM